MRRKDAPQTRFRTQVGLPHRPMLSVHGTGLVTAAWTLLWTLPQRWVSFTTGRNRFRQADRYAVVRVSRSKSLSTLGFLSIVNCPPDGVVGGYLLLTSRGRPLEFHCSAPIWPNRAQEILYGPTLRPFIYGELIGRSLVEHAKMRPDVVLVDACETLSMRDVVDLPLAWVTHENVHARERQADSVAPGPWRTAPGFEADQPILDERLTAVAGDLDLCEPFERIRNAIEEAQQMAA